MSTAQNSLQPTPSGRIHPHPLAITDEAPPLALRSTRNRPRTAVRRGAAQRAVLRSVRRGQGHGAGFVTAEPSWVAKRPQTLRPGRSLAAQRVVAGREDVRTPATPVVALSASSVRRADVRPIGHADVRCPRVRCPRDRCHPGVRTDGPPVSAALQPRCPHPGMARCGRPSRWTQWVRRAAVVRGRRGRPPAYGSEGKGWCCVGRGWLARGSTADWAAASHAYRLRCRLAACRQGSWSSARVPVGWLGSTRTSRCSPIPPQVRPGPVAGVVPDHGAGQGGGDHAPWSLGW
jgi:hypothetical protein